MAPILEDFSAFHRRDWKRKRKFKISTDRVPALMKTGCQ